MFTVNTRRLFRYLRKGVFKPQFQTITIKCSNLGCFCIDFLGYSGLFIIELPALSFCIILSFLSKTPCISVSFRTRYIITLEICIITMTLELQNILHIESSYLLILICQFKVCSKLQDYLNFSALYFHNKA